MIVIVTHTKKYFDREVIGPFKGAEQAMKWRDKNMPREACTIMAMTTPGDAKNRRRAK